LKENKPLNDKNSIDKKIRTGNLYAVYGALLTIKQKDILELYINEDLSLGEISETYSISRQAVFDTLKRSDASLEDYEGKLGFFEKVENQNRHIKSIMDKLKTVSEEAVLKGTGTQADLKSILKSLGKISIDI
jgi:uncharacterized protein